MLTYPTATVTLLLLGQGANAASTPKQRQEFMRAMKTSTRKAGGKTRRRLSASDQKEFKKALYGDSERSATLRKKFMQKSTEVTPLGERELQNYNNGNNANYADANGYNTGNRNSNYYRSNNTKDADDYFAAYGEWQNGFGFDALQYSLSYHRCAAVKQYDDDIAAQEDTTSVFATKHFAVFRFCPETTCMGDMTEDSETRWQEEQERYQEEQYEQQQQANGQYSNRYGENDPNCAKYNSDGECAEWNFLGARGDSCSSNYGEYMIELKDYLALMLEFQEDRFDTYCEYCEECMYDVYQAWLQKGGGDYNNRKLSYAEFKDSEEVARELGGNAYGGQAQDYFYHACPEYDTCAEYKNTCNGGVDETLAEFFECTEIEKNNGMVAYVGPHCAEDGFTVTLGVYSDEYCNEYIGNGANIASFIGQELDLEEDDLKSFYNSMNGQLDLLEYSNEDDVCIPCRKADLPYEDSDWEAYLNDDDQNDDDRKQEAQGNYGYNEITEICENLYKASARCDKHFRSYNNKAKQAKYAEAVAQEDLTCDFIDSVVMGNFNEMGVLNLSEDQTESQPEWLQNNMYAQQYGHYITEVTPLQIFFLIASIAACGIMAVWSMTLKKSPSKRGPWRPRRGINSVSPAGETADVSRQNSGIVMGRSQSNASYYVS